MTRVIFLIIFNFFFNPLAFSQLEPTRNFSVKDGLPSGVVYDCLQDRQGFMWFATAAGLARFDGFNFKVFTTKDGLTNNEILQIGLDADGSIWVFPFGASACIYDPATQKLFNENNYDELKKLSSKSAQLFVRRSAAGLICYGELKVFFLENKKIRVKDIRHISDLWPITKDSIIFLGHRKSYFLSNRDTIDVKFSDKPDSLFYMYVARCIDWGRWKIFSNSITPAMISLYQYTSDRSIIKRSEFSGKYLINNLSRFGSKIYLPTVNGVYVLDSLLTLKDFLCPGNNISRVFVDKSGNEWLCSLSGEGVYMRLKNDVKQYKAASGLPYENVTSLRIAEDGKLLCGDGNGNVYSFDPSEHDSRPTLLKKFPDAIRYIGKMGIYSIIYSNYKLLINDREVHENFGAIKTALPDTNGNLLIGSHWYLTRYDVKKNKTEKLKDSRRFVALSYSQGNLYYGNNNGTFKIQNVSPFSEVQISGGAKIVTEPVNHMISSNDGILWVATNTDGIAAIRNDKVIGHFTTSSLQPLTSNICKRLFVDRTANTIWVATNKGVNKISYSFSKDSLTAIINSITSSEGLNDDDVNDVYVKDGKVYAATIKGICIFNADLKSEEIPIRFTDVNIKAFYVQDSSASVSSNYDLKYWQNNISIKYSGICFTCNTKLIYQYRMLGTDNDTSWKTTTANTVEFVELKNGNYTFQVRTNQENMQEINFYIHPAFWQTNWFYALIAIAILASFFFTIKYITKQIRKREIEKTNINKKFAELEFQALQAQMNPHFVFNAMNTLQNYILKNESENASEYLAKFAKLMRLFLESSRDKFIEVRNEIELLKNYIELEQARLQHQFEYRIEIDPNVEMDTKIPSVMIQPFVENAILHGLRHKTEGNGLLVLSFIRKDQILECRIQDNGVGREQSSVINKTKDKLYKSQALNIIDEKVKTLKEISNVNIRIFTEDNFDASGKGAGTTVVIQFG